MEGENEFAAVYLHGASKWNIMAVPDSFEFAMKPERVDPRSSPWLFPECLVT